jgi:hypothetical protein
MKNKLSKSTRRRTIGLTFASYIAFVALTLLIADACKKSEPVNTIAQNTPQDATTSESIKLMRVAAINPLGDGKTTEVRFFESERIYLIDNIANAADLLKLQQSLKSDMPASVTYNNYTAAIKNVATPHEPDVQAYLNRPLFKSDKPVFSINIAQASPDRIDDVPKTQPESGIGLPPSTTNKLTAVIPDLATAQMIFDYFTQQSCDLPGPYGIDQCISFQYTEDGCYARAHKMRWILQNKYHYYVQKVFSFANSGNDELGVTANKWGGCCINWWYHVAPLVNIRTPSGVKAYVMDPAMFNTPVLLSAWLGAQQDKRCPVSGRTIHVSMYSIQPDSAYWPHNTAGTAYDTDPKYISTNSTLYDYSHLKSCP